LSSTLWGIHYFGLGWEKQQDKPHWFGTNMGLWVNRQDSYRRLLQHLTNLVKEPFELSGERKTLWFYRELMPADMADLETRLDETLAAWIDLWQRSGGVDAIAAGSQ
jgi:hypothetical protein